MTGRDTRGRFTEGNDYASVGGRLRAERLTAERRREIAAAGFAAMVARRFGGDVTAAARAIARAGNPADALFYGHTTH